MRKIDSIIQFDKPTIYVQDPNETVLGSTKNYYDSNMQWEKETDLAVLTFSIPANDSAAAYLTKLNLLTFVLNGRPWRFQISQAVYDTSGKSFQITAKPFSIVLNQSLVDAQVAPSQQEPAAFYVGQTLKGLDWNIGRDELGNSTLHTVAFSDQDTVLARLYSIADAFNCVLDFRIELDGLKVKAQYIDILNRLGSERNDIQLVYGDNVTNITKTVDCSTLATALEITGLQKDDDKGNSIDDAFFDLSYTSDDGRFTKPKDSYVMYDQTTNKSLNQGAAYILGTFDGSSIKSVQAAFTALTTQLKTQSQPTTTIDTALAYVPNTLTIGDTVRLISNDPDDSNYLSTDVQELDICLDDPSKSSAKFGDYQPLIDGDNLYDLTQIKQSIASAQALAATAQSVANQATQTANTANTNATTAQATADTANTTANQAQSAATQAAQTANTAQATANQAKTMLPVISTTAPTNPQEGQIWYEGDSSTDIKAIHKYVNGSWQNNTLLPTSMNVQQLSALSADLGTVNAGTLNTIDINSANMHNQTVVDDPDNAGQTITSDFYINENGLVLTAKRKLLGITDVVCWTWIDTFGQTVAGYSLVADFDKTNPLNGAYMSVRLDPVLAGLFFTSSQLGGSFYLNIQDAYQNSTRTVVWSSGWGTWGGGNGDIVLVRHGRLVTLFGYPKNTGSNYGNGAQIAQLPDWAKPVSDVGGINIYAVSFNSGVGNMQPCPVFLSTNGAIKLAGGAQSNGFVRIFPLTYPAHDM
jgi:phage minor structural protein